MEILLEDDITKKNVPSRSAPPSATTTRAKTQSSSTQTRRRSKKDEEEFDSLVSVIDRPTKKVVKRVVKKKVIKKQPRDTSTGILEPLSNFSLRMGEELPPPPLTEDVSPSDSIPLPRSKPNPFSFFQFEGNEDESPPPLPESETSSTLPSLSSDESDGEWEDDYDRPTESALDMLLNLPDASGEEEILGHSGQSWKDRALQAERNAAVWQNKYLQQKEELKEAHKRIKKLRAKEKADADQMDDILRKVERNLQQTRTRYEGQLSKMKQELTNTKRMLQHVTQCEEIDIPENFEEYEEFIQSGKVKARYASEQLHTLAENAETQVQGLLKGCAALKELATLLSSVDSFSDHPPL